MEKEEKFLEKCEYAFLVLDADGHILHTCWYEEEPGENERQHLLQELMTNEEFGLTEEAKKGDIILAKAPKEFVLKLREEFLNDLEA